MPAYHSPKLLTRMESVQIVLDFRLGSVRWSGILAKVAWPFSLLHSSPRAPYKERLGSSALAFGVTSSTGLVLDLELLFENKYSGTTCFLLQ